MFMAVMLLCKIEITKLNMVTDKIAEEISNLGSVWKSFQKSKIFACGKEIGAFHKGKLTVFL